MTILPPCAGSSKHSCRLSVMLAALGAASTIVIMVLHEHECSGDGCLLCLAATWAHALLCLCVGMSVARPIIRVLMHARIMRVLRTLWQDILPIGKYPTELPPLVATPLSMGVMLRI